MTQEESEKKCFRTICYEKNWDDTESRIWTIFDINEIRKGEMSLLMSVSGTLLKKSILKLICI